MRPDSESIVRCLGYKGKQNPCSKAQTQKNGYKYIIDSMMEKTH